MNIIAMVYPTCLTLHLYGVSLLCMWKFLDFWDFLICASSSINMNRNLIVILSIIAKLCGIFSFLKDSTISCIGLVDESITIEVKHTISLVKSIAAQFSPVSVMLIQLIPLAHIIFPVCMNGWNIIIAPPNGNNRVSLANDDLKDNVAIYKTKSKNISSIIWTNS